MGSGLIWFQRFIAVARVYLPMGVIASAADRSPRTHLRIPIAINLQHPFLFEDVSVPDSTIDKERHFARTGEGDFRGIRFVIKDDLFSSDGGLTSKWTRFRKKVTGKPDYRPTSSLFLLIRDIGNDGIVQNIGASGSVIENGESDFIASNLSLVEKVWREELDAQLTCPRFLIH